MFLELIATFAAGLGAAGLVLLINRVSGGRLPRWSMPVAAGLAMIGTTISSEMTWAPRTVDGLPEGVAVAETVTESAWYRPWTYLWPQGTRLMTVDTGTVRRNPDAPETRLVDIYLFARWQPTQQVAQLIHCSTKTRADVTDAALADPNAATWRPISANSTLVDLVCKE